MTLDDAVRAQVLELVFSSAEEGIADNLGDKKIIWKDIMREGDFPVTPGRKRKVPFKIVPTGKSTVTPDLITISMDEVMRSFEDKAFESVTIPLGHPKPGEKDVLNNSGYVESLRIVKKGDKHFLQGGLGFTEPDIAGKVRRGTIPNVSSGVFFNFTRKADDKTFPVALNHVCLTKQPWIDDLEPFQKVYASDDAIDDAEDLKIDVVDLQDGSDSGDTNNAQIIWNEQLSTKWIVEEIRTQLSPAQPEIEGVPSMPRPFYEVLDVSREDTALVEEWFKGDRKRWVIPFTIGDNKVSLSPSIRWVEVREAMVAASDDLEDRSYGKLTVKLNGELHDMLGKVGENYQIEHITTDGRCSVKNNDDGSVFMADFVEAGDSVLLSATSGWAQVQGPQPKPQEKKDRSYATDVALSLMFDDSPEGRVAVARQRRRQMLSRNSR